MALPIGDAKTHGAQAGVTMAISRLLLENAESKDKSMEEIQF